MYPPQSFERNIIQICYCSLTSRGSCHFEYDGMGSIPAIPDTRKVPLLLCHERFNEASFVWGQASLSMKPFVYRIEYIGAFNAELQY